MIGWRDILLGVLLPGAATAVVLLAGLLAGQRWWLRRALVPPAIAAGFISGYAALLRVPGFPPLDTTHWLFYAAAVCGVVAAIDALLWRAPVIPGEDRTVDEPILAGSSIIVWLVRFFIVLGLAQLLVWLLVRPMLVFHWTGADGPMWIGGIGLIMAVAWLLLDSLAARVSRAGGGLSLALALSLVTGISSLTIALSGTQKLGQLGGMLTAALLAVAVLGLWLPRELQVWRGMVLIFVVLHTTLLAAANEHLYASMTVTHGLLLVMSAPLAWAGEALPRRMGTWRGVVRVIAALVPAGIAAISAGIAFQRTSGGELW